MKFDFIIVLFLLPFIVSAQKTKEKLDTLLKKKDNEEYVAKYKNKITVRPFLQQQLMSLNFIDKEKEELSVIYTPNVKVYAGVDLNYRFLGASFLFKIPPLQKVQSRLGETKFINMKFSLNTAHFCAETYYQRYAGFYLFNAKEFNTTFHKNFSFIQDTFPQLENLKVSAFGINLNFQFSNKMSLAAAFNQTKRQLKSHGSFLFMMSYQFTGISNNDTLVPDSSIRELSNVARYKSGVYNTIGIAPGYGYTLVIKQSYYITAIGYVGVGLQPQYNKYFDDTEFKFRSSYKFNFKFAAGYNGEVFFAGISGGLDMNTINLDAMKIQVIPMFWKIGAGMRF